MFEITAPKKRGHEGGAHLGECGEPVVEPEGERGRSGDQRGYE
jgi:hypothetical protein